MKWVFFRDEKPMATHAVLVATDCLGDEYEHFFVAYYSPSEKEWNVNHFFNKKFDPCVRLEIKTRKTDMWCYIDDVDMTMSQEQYDENLSYARKYKDNFNKLVEKCREQEGEDDMSYIFIRGCPQQDM